MASNGNAAYDLSRYEATEQEQQPELRLVKRRQAVKVASVAPIKIIAVMLAVMSVITLMIYNRVLLTELNDDIAKSKRELTILQSENVRLQSEMESVMSLDSIESSIADIMSDMGMARITQENVKYVVLAAENTVVAPEPEATGLKGWINGIIEQIKAYMGE